MEWISVNDRLPETTAQHEGKEWQYQSSKKVLIWIGNDNEPSIACYCNGQNFENWAVDFGDDLIEVEINEVTHWMPLPPKPIETTNK